MAEEVTPTQSIGVSSPLFESQGIVLRTHAVLKWDTCQLEDDLHDPAHLSVLLVPSTTTLLASPLQCIQ